MAAEEEAYEARMVAACSVNEDAVLDRLENRVAAARAQLAWCESMVAAELEILRKACMACEEPPAFRARMALRQAERVETRLSELHQARAELKVLENTLDARYDHLDGEWAEVARARGMKGSDRDEDAA